MKPIEKQLLNLDEQDPPVKPEKNIPIKPDKNPDPTSPKPGGNEPGKIDPTRIEEPSKNDPTRISEPDQPIKNPDHYNTPLPLFSHKKVSTFVCGEIEAYNNSFFVTRVSSNCETIFTITWIY